MLGQEEVELYSTENEEKSSVVEIWNRTMKEKMWKMFSARNSWEYLDELKNLVWEYNYKKHRSIGMTPAEASKKKNEKKVFGNLYGKFSIPKKKKPKFAVGDKVRISVKKRTFEKGFEPNWTEEIFVVDKVNYANPVTYKLMDLLGEEITGSFHKEELQKTNQEIFRIEKVLKNDKKKKRSFVKWKGYPGKFNSWVPTKWTANL